MMAPFQTEWVAARLGRSVDETPSEMLVLKPDGAIVGGIDALLLLASGARWTRMLTLPARAPGIKFVLERLYRMVARQRYRLWGRCSDAGCASCGRACAEGGQR